MIFCQDRTKIEKTGKRIYLLQVGDRYQILNKHSDDEVTLLGEYEKKCDAEEILKTIFQYLRGRKESYCMPKLNMIIH
jgi:hypothetical protein